MDMLERKTRVNREHPRSRRQLTVEVKSAQLRTNLCGEVNSRPKEIQTAGEVWSLDEMVEWHVRRADVMAETARRKVGSREHTQTKRIGAKLPSEGSGKASEQTRDPAPHIHMLNEMALPINPNNTYFCIAFNTQPKASASTQLY